MNNKDFIQTIGKQLSLVTEAIRPQDFKKSADLILQYFKKNGFPATVRMPSFEPYANSIEKGVGVRYFYGGLKSVRLNWAVGSAGSSNIVSADIWTDDENQSKGGGSDIHIAFGKQMSLARALPSVVAVMKDPKTGTEYVFEEHADTLVESVTNFLVENSVKVQVDVAQKFIDHLEDGVRIADLTKIFGNTGYKISVQLREMYPQNFEKKGTNIFFRGSNKDINIEKVLGSAGGTKVVVSAGPSMEKISNTPAETQLEADGDRLVFEEQLKDLESVTKLLISGAAYSMFVAGKGGVGKCVDPTTPLILYMP